MGLNRDWNIRFWKIREERSLGQLYTIWSNQRDQMLFLSKKSGVYLMKMVRSTKSSIRHSGKAAQDDEGDLGKPFFIMVSKEVFNSLGG